MTIVARGQLHQCPEDGYTSGLGDISRRKVAQVWHT